MNDEIGTINLADGVTDEEDRTIIRTKRASGNSLMRITMAEAGDMDGRSHWMWFRLPNGDLIFGCFPHGDTYFATEDDHSF